MNRSKIQNQTADQITEELWSRIPGGTNYYLRLQIRDRVAAIWYSRNRYFMKRMLKSFY